MSKLVINNSPTKEYLQMLEKQRKWLYNNGTTVSRANHLIKILEAHL